MKRISLFLATVLLVCVYFWTKAGLLRLHVQGLRSDPCDAVNVAAVMVLSLALIRAAWLAVRRSQPRAASKACEAVILAMLTSFVAEVIALLRHVSSISTQLAHVGLLLACEGAAGALAVGFLIQNRGTGEQARSWRPLLLSSACAVVILFVCPEWPENWPTPLGHFVTVLLGLVILLGIVRQALLWLSVEARDDKGRRIVWGEGLCALAGGLLLCFAFFITAVPHSRLMIALASDMLLTYAFLAVPLGLFPAAE